jgi:hypothetical protein
MMNVDLGAGFVTELGDVVDLTGYKTLSRLSSGLNNISLRAGCLSRNRRLEESLSQPTGVTAVPSHLASQD